MKRGSRAERVGSIFLLVVAFLTGSEIKGGTYSGGSGTAQDPYLIFTADDMDNAAQYSGDWDKHFKLMADVDMSLCSGAERAMVGEYLFNVPRAIALDVDGAKLYWADWGYDAICRADLDGAHRERIITAPTPLGLAIDAINNKTYWTDNHLDNIRRADLDGGNIEELVRGLTNPVGIALDVAGGKMYWVDKGTGELERANLDGSAVDTILSGLLEPDDLGLDLSGSKVYWTENSGGKIGRANLDGSLAEYVVTGLSSPYGIVVDAANSHIYWSDSYGIRRADLDGAGGVQLISAGDVSILDLDIDFGVGKIYWVGNSPDNPLDKMCRADLDGSDIEVLMRNFFTGVFDGDGHRVRNFTLSYSAKERVGIFGVLETSGAVVKNLGVVNPVVAAPSVERVGGLIGQIFAGTVEKCFVKGGSITGAKLVGGLTGAGSDCSIVDCYTQTAVTGDRYVGGMMGLDFSSSFSRCYAATVVDGNSLTGGLIGGGSSPVFSDCFWDVEVSGQSTSDGGVGKSTTDMQTARTFTDAGWDFATPIWTICEGKTYPRLWYEYLVCEKYSGGDGSAENPYRIATAEDLNDIGNHVEDFNKSFVMVNDINLADYTGTQFNIIGPNSTALFTGVFDGNGHVISNFTYESDGEDFIGLFGCVSGDEAQIRDLGLIRADVNAGTGSRVGSLAGLLVKQVISGCYSEDCRVCGANDIGGLVGLNTCGTIYNCYATGSVSGDEQVGGLVGFSGSTISSSYASVTVFSRDAGAGGFIGGQNANGHISNCYATGSVISMSSAVGGFIGGHYGTTRDSHATGDAQGTVAVGGFAGSSLFNSSISRCYATGSARGTELVGGLVGYGGSVKVLSDSYAVGSVTGDAAVGGLLGINMKVVVSNCYAAGVVDGNCDVGGLVGFDGEDTWAGTYFSSFWDSDVNPDVNGIGNTTDPNVIGRTTGQMQSRSTFTDAGWDFVGETINGPNDVWRMCVDGVSYPLLWWQFTSGDLVCPDGVDFADYSHLARQWQDTGCAAVCDCYHADLDFSGVVDWRDFAILAAHWLEGAGP